MDGKQQHTYQYDSNKHRLFTLPDRITTNNNKDIVAHTIMCPAVVVTTSRGLNCVVTFILECPVYVHLKPPSHPTTTTLPVSPDVTNYGWVVVQVVNSQEQQYTK
jgi:hypothetical protein